MELISCLAHENDQKDETICHILGKAVEREPCDLHAQTKQGIECMFARAVEWIYDSINKYTAYKEKNNSQDPILYADLANNSTYDDDDNEPTHCEQQSDIQADSDTLFPSQRRFTLHLRTLSRTVSMTITKLITTLLIIIEIILVTPADSTDPC